MDQGTITNREEIYGDILKVLESHNRAGIVLGPDTDLASDLHIDSVAAMDLIMEIEDRFEIDIPLNALSDVRKVKDLVALVHEHAGRPGQASGHEQAGGR